MSWSVAVIGTPEKIVEYLEQESARLTGQSKVEFDDAKPHIVALVKENFKEAGEPVLVDLQANGSGSGQGDVQVNRSCSVSVKPIYARLLL
jgi:hypothetical protein